MTASAVPPGSTAGTPPVPTATFNSSAGLGLRSAVWNWSAVTPEFSFTSCTSCGSLPLSVRRMVVMPPGMLSGAAKLYSMAWTENRFPTTGPADAEAAGLADAAPDAAGLAEAGAAALVDAAGLVEAAAGLRAAAEPVLPLADAGRGPLEGEDTLAAPPQAARARARTAGIGMNRFTVSGDSKWRACAPPASKVCPARCSKHMSGVSNLYLH